MSQTHPTHPWTREKAAKLSGRRCYCNGVPAVAYPGRSGYVNVTLLEDPGRGSLVQRGVPPENVEFLDEEESR